MNILNSAKRKIHTLKTMIKGASIVVEQKGEMDVVRLVIAIFLIAILAAALMPTAIDQIEAGNNASGTWTAAETATWSALGILLIVAIIAAVAGIAYKAFS